MLVTIMMDLMQRIVPLSIYVVWIRCDFTSVSLLAQISRAQCAGRTSSVAGVCLENESDTLSSTNPQGRLLTQSREKTAGPGEKLAGPGNQGRPESGRQGLGPRSGPGPAGLGSDLKLAGPGSPSPGCIVTLLAPA